jgi:hypothetical protein
MKTFPVFAIGEIASFVLTVSFFAAASDDQGFKHWVAQQTSALAAMANTNG